MKRIIFLILLFYCSFSLAQEKTNIGFGASVGYKCPVNEVGYIIEYKFKRIFDLYFGLTSAKFNGIGYSIGSDIYLTQKSWQPCIGVTYNYQLGKKLSIGEHNVDETFYEVKTSKNLICILGIRIIGLFDDKNANGFVTFTPYLSYRYSYAPNKVVHTGGVIREDRERIINNRIGNGFGLGLKILYFINRHKTN